MTETKVAVAHRESPYFGLDYYDERFGAWFFGRESDGGKIITNLRAARLTLLHAESGVGKTSLLRAGVAWRLHRLADDMFARGRPVRSIPVVFSSWKDDPATELAAAVAAAVRPYLSHGDLPAAQAAGPLDAAIAAASEAANASLLIMLDQFEEYFLYLSREPVPGRFADELARCVNRTGLRANFLIAIREDAYAQLGDLFKGRIANVYGNYLHIDYLDRASAEMAIRGPVEVYNSQPDITRPVIVEDELVAAVLDEVRAWDGPAPDLAGDGDQGHIATPLLQLVMQRIWDAERADGSHELRLSTLQRLHGVKMIVDDHLEKALGALSGAERATAVDMFDHLVTPSGGKIAESVSDLAQRTGNPENRVDEVLRKLDDERILRPVPAAPGQDPVRFRRYEIFHDVLAAPINRAIAARADQRRARRFRWLAAVAVVLLVAVAAVAVVFGYLLNSANTEKLTAESRQLAADADLNVAADPDLSAALALQALSLRPTSLAEDALRTGLPGVQTRRILDDGSAVTAAVYDPADPDEVVSADSTGAVWIWDVKTGERLRRLAYADSAETGAASAVAFNPAGTQVAVGYSGSPVVVIFDARTGRSLKKANINENVSGLDFVGSTGELAIAGPELVLWKYNTTECCDLGLVPGNEGVLLSPDPANPAEFIAATYNGLFVVTLDHSGKPHRVLLSSQIFPDAKFSPDGSQVVATDNAGDVEVYQVATRKVTATFTVNGADAVNAAFSPNGKQVVAGYEGGTARVWDVATRLQLTLLTGHTGPVASVQFSPDGQEVATASQDGTIRVWYAEPRELQADFAIPKVGGSTFIYGADYTPDRIMTADSAGNVYVYSVRGQLKTTIKPGANFLDLDWDRAGTKVMMVDYAGAVKIWQANGFSYTLQHAYGSYGNPEGAYLSPDGSSFAIVTDDTSMDNTANSFNNSQLIVLVVNADTGKLVRRLHAANHIGSIAFNPNGRQVIGSDQSGQIEVWAGAASHPQILGRPGLPVTAVNFNQRGSEFVAASAGGQVTVRDARDGHVLASFNACRSPNDAAFSPDGSKIVVACSDGTVRVFDTGTRRTLTVITATSGVAVADAGFSPDGKSIVVGLDSGGGDAVEIWNAELATASLPTLERIADQRVVDKLTAAQSQQYLSGAGG